MCIYADFCLHLDVPLRYYKNIREIDIRDTWDVIETLWDMLLLENNLLWWGSSPLAGVLYKQLIQYLK